MEEMSRHGRIGRAAIKADMDRKTAGKYIAAGTLPSQMVKPRDWRTREDPFAEHGAEIDTLLAETPELEAKTIFALLCEKYPGRYEPGQLRTLQRRVHHWRAARGHEQEITLAQHHRPGEAAQTDFTDAAELKVTIGGQLYAHLLCVFVLPFSNWLWATVCQSESIAALRKGVQRALFQLGRVPKYHQTDNSTAATHRIPAGREEIEPTRKRPFNEAYLAVMRHFGMTARTTEVRAKEQNGDVEAGNGAIKRRLEQALLVRGSREFESVEAWQQFVDGVARKANVGRGARVGEELNTMRELSVERLAEFVEESARVSEWSTIRVRNNAYSVPSRLIGETLKVRVYEDRIEAFYGGELQLSCERIAGRKQHRIDYRHIIWSLLRKPGAFARYVYREEMFPTPTFRRAYDAIVAVRTGIKADVEYLRILHEAASTMQSEVETALGLLLAEGATIEHERVRELVQQRTRPSVPAMAPLRADLTAYDALLGRVGT